MFFNSIKEIYRLRKEIKRLLSKIIWNTYLKITIEEKWPTKNFDFISLKSLSPGQFLGAPTEAEIIKLSNFFLQL